MTTQTLLNTAITAAITAGKEILNIYNDPAQDFSVEKKSDNSPLTIADKKSHEVIVEQLKATSLPILSEEGAEIEFSEREKWNRFWLIDPLDGTKEFIKKNGEFTVNIALVEDGESTAGVIYVPVTGELYFASEETGAAKVEKAGDLSIDEILQQAQKLPFKFENESFIAVASRSHMSDETKAYIDELKEKHSSVDVVSSGSSLKICLVAEGKADVYPRFGPTMEWDTAAGHAIAKHAGKNIFLTDEVTELQYNKENLLNPWFVVR